MNNTTATATATTDCFKLGKERSDLMFTIDQVVAHGYKIDSKDRVPGLFMEDGSLATIPALVEHYANHGISALISLISDSALIHG